MVDSIANTAEDLLIQSMPFKVPNGASYVTDRRSVSFFTAGSNIYQSGSGAKIIRINVTGDGWLDLGSVRLHYTLVNNDTGVGKYLRTLGGPWSFFRRVRCLIGGEIVDDTDYYSRVHEMLHICSSNANRENDDIEGFGYRRDSRADYGAFAEARTRVIPPANSNATKWNAMSVCFKPLCGF